MPIYTQHATASIKEISTASRRGGWWCICPQHRRAKSKLGWWKGSRTCKPSHLLLPKVMKADCSYCHYHYHSVSLVHSWSRHGTSVFCLCWTFLPVSGYWRSSTRRIVWEVRRLIACRSWWLQTWWRVLSQVEILAHNDRRFRLRIGRYLQHKVLLCVFRCQSSLSLTLFQEVLKVLDGTLSDLLFACVRL